MSALEVSLGNLCSSAVIDAPTAQFDHRKRTWLVLWEGEVAIELPPWVVFVYPSSLFTHFNIDVNGERELTTYLMAN